MDFEELYYHELAERERVRSAIGVSVGVLALLGGLLGSMIQTAWIDTTVAGAAFAGLMMLSIASFLAALVYAVRSYYGEPYQIMPFAMECREYRDQLIAWHTQYGDGKSAAAEEFAAYLETQYAVAAEANGWVNWRRSALLSTANRAAILCGFAALAAFAPLVIHRAGLPDPVQKVEVIRVPTMSGQGADRMTDEKPKPSTPTPPPPPKPTPPPLRELREGQIPRKK
jgi:hypothetical protein